MDLHSPIAPAIIILINKKEAPMDQTLINATNEFLQSQIVSKDERIKELEQHVQKVTDRDYNTASKLQAMRDNMHEWTTNELENEDISIEQAEAIANICGFELTKEVEAEVTVVYNLTLQVPVGEDAEDIINNIDFEAVSYDTDTISWLSASVDNISV